jgi:uracil-DNA glycosylase
MNMLSNVRLESSWLRELESEFSKDYFIELQSFLGQEKQNGKIIYPPDDQIFAALHACSFDDVKVVIIGQDPYHGSDQANGLCFSVASNVKIPPSLANIYKELYSDVHVDIPHHGDLGNWAKQGVLLLNATLTVEAGNAGSHQNKGWENLTDKVIEIINEKRENVVFMLWGGYAKKKGRKLDKSKHLVLESGHPSPLSANRGHWFGNKHFSQCTSYLELHKKKPIRWSLD